MSPINPNSIKPLSAEDFADFMHKLSTESTKVVALLVNPVTGLSFSLAGRPERDGDTFIVWGKGASNSSRFSEASSLRISIARLGTLLCRFADPRILPPLPVGLEGREDEIAFSFGLVFNLPDGSLLIFMDFSELPPPTS